MSARTQINNLLKNKNIHLFPRKIYQKLGLEQTLLNHSSRCSSAAPIRESTKKYFESLGLFIAEFYGSTETSGPISTILEKRNK